VQWQRTPDSNPFTFQRSNLGWHNVRRDLRDLSAKINKNLQPIFTSRKLTQDMRVTENKPSFVNQHCVVYEFKCNLRDSRQRYWALRPEKVTWYILLLVQCQNFELCACPKSNLPDNLRNGREVYFPCCRTSYRRFDRDLSTQAPNNNVIALTWRFFWKRLGVNGLKELGSTQFIVYLVCSFVWFREITARKGSQNEWRYLIFIG